MEQRLYEPLQFMGRYTAVMMMSKAGVTRADLIFYNLPRPPVYRVL